MCMHLFVGNHQRANKIRGDFVWWSDGVWFGGKNGVKWLLLINERHAGVAPLSTVTSTTDIVPYPHVHVTPVPLLRCHF